MEIREPETETGARTRPHLTGLTSSETENPGPGALSSDVAPVWVFPEEKPLGECSSPKLDQDSGDVQGRQTPR